MNTLEIADRVSEQYHRYLRSTFRFRDPALRESFEEALAASPLTKGPFLEGTRVFKPGATLCEICHDLFPPDEQPDAGFFEALMGNRRLYQHQEDSIRKVAAGRNVVIATGTGSGKTEAFLYPILLDLLKRQQTRQSDAGVRAMVLYPMNALANDQRDRLAAPPQDGVSSGGILYELDRRRSAFRFTFGQYTGQTPEDTIERNQSVFRGELATRVKMRTTPPNILLTNYSMLEYLLLRPSDSPLFDGANALTWRFLVLDEAHQYRGAKGIEMAMLIRRLKQRLRESGHKSRFTCIATSASLSGGESDRAEVARFAQDLFDEPFDANDVILGDYQEIQSAGELDLAIGNYAVVLDALRNGSNPESQRLIAAHPGGQIAGMALKDQLSRLMQMDRRATRLRQLVRGEPTDIRAVVAKIFPELDGKDGDAGRHQLGQLAEILAQTTDADGAPLLTGRYHVLLKAMESAFVTYVPQKRVTLDRRDPQAPHGSFEVALCRECGQHYFVGKIEENHLVEAVRDPGDIDFGVRFFRPLDSETLKIGDSADEPETDESSRHELCLECGAISRTHVACSCAKKNQIYVLQEASGKERPDQIAKCGSCGYSAAGRDPVRELQHGTDGPHAVIATALFQNLSDKQRKLLAFSDGRQEAAFFAWYFEESYRDVLSRNLILKALDKLNAGDEAGETIIRVAGQLTSVYDEYHALPTSKSAGEARDDAYRAIVREALTDERRISLEGIGLMRWQWHLSERLIQDNPFLHSPWSLPPDEAAWTINHLLDTLRRSWTIELAPPKGITITWGTLDMRRTQSTAGMDSGRGTRTRSHDAWVNWDSGKTERAIWLAKLLCRIHPEIVRSEAIEQAVDALRSVWDAIVESDRAAEHDEDRLFVLVNNGIRLNLNHLRAYHLKPDDIVFRCDTCGRLQPHALHNCCAHRNCKGSLKPLPIGDLESDHYRAIYHAQLPGYLRSEEHTAQLNYEFAKRFQEDFKGGKINLLSSSTTFEVGVDLGDLNTVLLRNVPPEAFNYAQRVGRAGRRVGSLGLAVTYCRRSPHDLYHFAQPDRIIRGLSAPAHLSIKNDKIIQRHVTAWALSHYFRNHPERFGTLINLTENLEQPSALASIHAHLIQHADELETALKQMVPANTKTADALNNRQWIEFVAGADSQLAIAQVELSADAQNLTKLQKESADGGDYETAKWAKTRLETIARENVLSFLSKHTVIPKYGFPVDVVGLDTTLANSKEGSSVELQRDLGLAIAEFAPTAELIANKQVWTSYGLKRVPAKEWPVVQYRRCHEHNTFVEWKLREPEPQLSCGCKVPLQKYIVPQFGFTTERGAKTKTPTGRPNRLFSTRPYFAKALSGASESMHIKSAKGELLVQINRASPGLMAMLCEGAKGRMFYVCPECGYGALNPQKNNKTSHKTPYGRPCTGQLAPYSLGHEFETDVLRLDFPHLASHADEVWLQLGVAYALASGASEALDVPATDLNATIYPRAGGPPQVLLYDNVPGGAGLVSRLESIDVFKLALNSAVKKVSGLCGCGEDESCYGCLRSYGNQFAHRRLKRGPAHDFLAELWTDLKDSAIQSNSAPFA